MGRKWKEWKSIFSWAPKSLWAVTATTEVKDNLLYGGKTMTNLDSILKSRDINLLTKVYIVKAMIFSIVMYRSKRWTIRKTGHRRIDVFKLWCWRRLLRVLWTAKSSNQSILKETNHKYSFERIILKLKLQYFGHLMQSQLIEKDPDAGKDWGQEEKGVTEDKTVGWYHGLNGHECEQTPGDSEEQGSLEYFIPWGYKSRTGLNDWKTTIQFSYL